MPRVNRDLERRLAARRERERRRGPGERQYRFAPSTPRELPNGTAAGEEAGASAATTQEVARRPAGSPRAAPGRPVPPPFASYRAEYAYVASDLRRIALVVGGLLAVILIIWLATGG